MCLQIVIMESKRTLEAPERSLCGVWHNGCPKDTSRKLHINFQISTFLESGLTPGFSRASSKEFKRTLEVPERSLGGVWHNGRSKDTSRKLHINFQISTCPGSAPTPGFSRASSKCLPWSLRGCWWFLRGVLVVFDIMDASRVHQGSCISIFILLPFWEMLHLLCVSRASSWSPRGRWRFLRGVLVVFDMMDDPRIHQGSCISIFIRLPTWEVLQLLGEWGGNKTWPTHPPTNWSQNSALYI